MARAVEVRITGEVQDVSFRAYAAHEAVRQELAGWVRNDEDGAVAMRLQGEDDVVDHMLTWCRAGSPGARVADVEVTEVEPDEGRSFVVEY